jgi:5'-nucleotidase
MRILLTNDDGYRALGINTLYQALIKAGHEVIIVAPERNSSGAGQSITVYMPISITCVSENIYFVSSTPADGIRLGLQYVYETPENYPDMIISGINMGLLHGIRSLAISTPGPEFNNLDSAAKIVVDLLDRISYYEKQCKIDGPFIWNINIPNKPYEEISGFEATKLGAKPLHKPLEKQITPRGNVVYWQGESSDLNNAEIGTDVDVFLRQEKVSITPLLMLPTDYLQMPLISALTI